MSILRRKEFIDKPSRDSEEAKLATHEKVIGDHIGIDGKTYIVIANDWRKYIQDAPDAAAKINRIVEWLEQIDPRDEALDG